MLIIFVSVPIAEIGVFIEVGGRYGLWPTIAAVFATAIIGTALIRHQGLNIVREVQAHLDAGQLPARQIFDGLCLLVAGALLLTPGFITDAVGFILLVPGLRSIAAAMVLSRVERHQEFRAGPGPAPGPGGVVIDGEFAEVADPEAEADAAAEAAPRLTDGSDPSRPAS
ncbi:MAG: FxsA family protein [Magnetovibrio sp.]|nr:FxsA family protein [Magnetovibrio sp.]